MNIKDKKRAYLIIPKLIRQPTWGGQYLFEIKNFLGLPFLQKEKIGQSYELFSGTKLFLPSTEDSFPPEIGFADKTETVLDNFKLKKNIDYILLGDLVKTSPIEVLGERVFSLFHKMPLLIKITHSRGNSFQLHLKPDTHNPKWQPKAESWYYLEDGLLTFGIKPGIDIKEYKNTCILIEKEMKRLSQGVINQELSLATAQNKSQDFIRKNDPHRFVNLHRAEKHSLIDLSLGGIHHSWEEDESQLPLGNVVYEVQQDVMDPVSTIRSFDQGKFKNDGSIREINIEDYFRYLDTEPFNNEINNFYFKLHQSHLAKTKFYSLDLIGVDGSFSDQTKDSFVHLYARDGEVEIETEENSIHLKKGFSCFIPWSVKKYQIKSRSKNTAVLKTTIDL